MYKASSSLKRKQSTLDAFCKKRSNVASPCLQTRPPSSSTTQTSAAYSPLTQPAPSPMSVLSAPGPAFSNQPAPSPMSVLSARTHYFPINLPLPLCLF